MTEEEKNRYINLLTSQDEEIRITTMIDILENKINVLNPTEFYEIYNKCSNIFYVYKNLDYTNTINKFYNAYTQNPIYLASEINRLNQDITKLENNLDRIKSLLRNMIDII